MSSSIGPDHIASVHKAEVDDLVSVVIPTRDRPELLARAISTVVSQTYRSLEILIVDDASERDVKSVVDDCQDDRIKLLRHEVRRGGSAARNTGIHHSSGHYVAFLDDDDEWFPEKIELQLKDLRNKGSEYKISYCQREFCDDTIGSVIGVSKTGRDGNHLRELLSGDAVPSTSCVLLERACLEQVGGFRVDVPSLDDRELWIRLSRFCDFASLNRVLVRKHIHGEGRITGDKRALLASMKIVHEVHRDLFMRDRKSYSRFLLDLGRTSAMAGEHRYATLAFLKSIAAYPLRPDPYVSLLLQVTKRADRRRSESNAIS